MWVRKWLIEYKMGKGVHKNMREALSPIQHRSSPSPSRVRRLNPFLPSSLVPLSRKCLPPSFFEFCQVWIKFWLILQRCIRTLILGEINKVKRLEIEIYMVISCRLCTHIINYDVWFLWKIYAWIMWNFIFYTSFIVEYDEFKIIY